MKRSESRTSNPLVDVYKNVFITHFLFCLFCLYFSVTSWTPHYGIEQGLHNRKSGTGHNLSKYGPSLHEGNFAVKAVSTRARLSVHWQSAVINTIHADIFLLKHPPVTAELSTESPAAGPYAEKKLSERVHWNDVTKEISLSPAKSGERREFSQLGPRRSAGRRRLFSTFWVSQNALGEKKRKCSTSA